MKAVVVVPGDFHGGVSSELYQTSSWSLTTTSLLSGASNSHQNAIFVLKMATRKQLFDLREPIGIEARVSVIEVPAWQKINPNAL